MHIVVAGAHGQVAMLLHPLLVARGHSVRGLIRNPAHAPDLRAAGVEPVTCDLESDTNIEQAVGAADTVVFAAGAGPGSGAERKWSVDRDGALKLMEAARINRIPRVVMISTMNPEQPRGSEVFQVYQRAKAEADAALRDSGLAWTILRPGKLTEAPGTGRVSMGRALERGEIPRADVAAVLLEVLEHPETAGLQLDVVAGQDPIPVALAACLGRL